MASRGGAEEAGSQLRPWEDSAMEVAGGEGRERGQREREEVRRLRARARARSRAELWRGLSCVRGEEEEKHATGGRKKKES